MADTKISALPASTTPLAGTEVLPIVQSGVTRQVSVANLTAGRVISATQLTLTTGNLVIGTSGRGIDFSATPGTGTSELLSDYEEGTFSPTITPASGSITSYTVNYYVYTKIGRVVTLIVDFTITNYGTGSGALRVTTPFTPLAGTYTYGVGQEVFAVGTRLYLNIAVGAFDVTGISGTPSPVNNSRFTGSITYMT
jgi:hypothetical protein